MAGLLRPTLLLLAGGALAQLLPLLLGPWLTRLYSPVQFGQFTLFAAVTANLAAVACARYDQALPLVADDTQARDLMALCLRVWGLVTLLSVGVALLLAWRDGQRSEGAAAGLWAWLPLAVAASGAVQWLTLWSTRAERFTALSTARVVQYGGGALAQGVGGTAPLAAVLGGQGLVVGPVLANLATLACLHKPAPLGGWRALWQVPRDRWWAMARQHRSFPLLNTPHAFLGALQDTLAVLLLAWWLGDAAAGFWGLALRYLKAPATLVGGAVAQVLYPRLARSGPAEARQLVRQLMLLLGALALPLVLLLLLAGPALFAWAFGEPWRAAGELARALAPYIGAHFVASPLAVVTQAWHAQGWALRRAVLGQGVFLLALAGGLMLGGRDHGLQWAAWAVSAGMLLYFGSYFWSLATWREVPDVR